MRASLFYLIDRCKVSDLALTASSFSMLCDGIQRELYEFGKEIGADGGVEYVTNRPNLIHKATPEGILWVFLLLNPGNPFRRHLDSRREMLLESALALDPSYYAKARGYNYDHVAEKLQCSRMEGIYITQFWEILPVYSDRERKTLNLSYLVEMGGCAKHAAGLYAIYAHCSTGEADKAIRDYLSKGADDLSVLYPGGKPDVKDGENVMKIDLAVEDGEAAWLSFEHPFFSANCPSPKRSEEAFFNYLKHSIFRYALNVAYGYRDGHIVYRGYLTNGYESKDIIEFVRRERYSYHDGGGGCSDRIRISALSPEKRKSLTIPKEMMAKEYYAKRGLSVPPCEGYWEDDGAIYLMNPFDMKGILVLESESRTW